MQTLIKSITTIFVWLLTLGLLAFALNEIGGAAIILAIVLIIPLAVLAEHMWQTPRYDTGKKSAAKAKRRELRKMLEDLSDDQLDELRQRLSDRDELAEQIYIGEDGELVRRR